MLRGLPLVLVAVALALPPPVGGEEGPSVAITAPGEGAVLGSSSVVVKLDVEDFRLVPPGLVASALPGEGWIHVSVDGRAIRGAVEDGARVVDTNVLVSGLRPGTHLIRVELRAGDGSKVGAFDEVNVTVAEDAPYIRFREGKPWPGQLHGGSIRAEVSVERAQGVLVDTVEVRWSLDGAAVKTSTATWHEFRPLPAGVHEIRADLLVNGRVAAYDELYVGVPDLDFEGFPDDAVAGEDFAPASVPYRLTLDGASLTDHGLRLLLDGEPVDGASSLEGRIEIPLGEHVLAAELLRDGRPVVPSVATAERIFVTPPAPEVRVKTPNEFATMTPRFVASVVVSNLTLVAPGGAPVDTEGHLHWYLDDEKVADGPDTSLRFADLVPGLHTLEVRVVANDDTETDVTSVRRFNVDLAPGDAQETTGGALANASPGAALASAVLALAAVALLKRR